LQFVETLVYTGAEVSSQRLCSASRYRPTKDFASFYFLVNSLYFLVIESGISVMPESTQKKLSRVRKPRVHITYDVETEGAEPKKELPFIVGVMGDFSGNPTKKLEPLKKRKFTQIDATNFNEVMSSISPELVFRVPDLLSGEPDKELPVSLVFNKMEDFDPAAVAEQIEPLKKLLVARERLKELLVKIDGSPKLEGLLEQVLQDPDALGQVNFEDEGKDSN
jgi:type VI secretion system protein ImpB